MDPPLTSPLNYYPVGVLPEVSSLSREELEDLLTCEEKLAEFVSGLPQLGPLHKQCEQLVQQNQALAQATMERSAAYEGSRDATLCKVEEVTALRAVFDEMTLEQQRVSEKLVPASIQESLLISAVQSDEESEKIAEDFLAKQIDVDKFLGNYMEKRIEAHLRKFKGERLGAQLQELHKAGF